MIRACYFNRGGEPETDLKPEEIAAKLGRQGVLWVDFAGEPPQTCETILQQTFGFHPLAVDDALRESHIPKLDDWDEYLYVVLNAIVYHRGDGNVETLELDAFLGKNYLVTLHDLAIPALERAWESAQRDQRHSRQGADHLLYKLADEMTVDYMAAVEELDEEIEWVEDQVFLKPTPETVQHIFTLKRATLILRRTLSYMREVLNKLARDDYPVIDSKDQIYFRDIYDHLVRLHDITESLRDLVSGVLDIYLSVINNRMNEVMKTLTIITTLFMPLSFLAGFFGMNFFLPKTPVSSLMERPVLIFVLVLMAFMPFLMFRWMRRRGWM